MGDITPSYTGALLFIIIDITILIKFRGFLISNFDRQICQGFCPAKCWQSHSIFSMFTNCFFFFWQAEKWNCSICRDCKSPIATNAVCTAGLYLAHKLTVNPFVNFLKFCWKQSEFHCEWTVNCEQKATENILHTILNYRERGSLWVKGEHWVEPHFAQFFITRLYFCCGHFAQLLITEIPLLFN